VVTEVSDNSFVEWRLLSPENTLIRSWNDGLAVVYGSLGGETHLLSPLAGEILRLLATGPHTPEMLLRNLAEVFEDHDSAGALDTIETVLSELRNIDLISSGPN
jgi:PqqD family protein of HPr-rel-A system